jgi:hypothetical protein
LCCPTRIVLLRNPVAGGNPSFLGNFWETSPENTTSTFGGDQAVMRSLKFINHTFWALSEPYLNI